jgi:UDP-2,4-diacetamido-2,4,6-trideoxy-beta-L-altropyranose hydrolase
MTGPRVFFRADADRLIGTGHIARCRCLARGLMKQGVPSSFLMAGAASPVTESLEREGFEVLTLPEGPSGEAGALAAIILASGADRRLLIVDSPRTSFYSGDFQEGIRSRGVRLMMIVFRSEGHFAADAVHNQNLLALEESYSAEAHTRLLLGPRYVILDERFSRLRGSRSNPPTGDADTLFLFFGGADASNLTMRVLRSLASLGEPLRRVVTVVGPLHGRTDEISAFARENPGLPVDLHVDTPGMPELMAEADIAVTSGGLTIWELACLGVPNVVISTSERERIHTPLLERRGGCLYLGHQDAVTEPSIREAVSGLIGNPARRAEMARAGRKLVDGRGTERVIEQVMDLLSQSTEDLRKGGKP